MTLPASPVEHVHIVGVAGVGMNAVAQLLLHLGHRVTGSDRFADQGRELPILRQLRGLGIKLHPQDGSALTPDTLLVLSTAIESDNPERVRAAQLGCREIHRARMLADSLPETATTVAIAGTAGKTTTTGLTGFLLHHAGLSPTVINGAALVDWQTHAIPGNVRYSGSTKNRSTDVLVAQRGNTDTLVGQRGDQHPHTDIWVFEADESDRSFLNFHPTHAVITNIAADHFGLAESIDLFRQFAAQVQHTIICGPGVAPLLTGHTNATLLTPAPSELTLRMLGDHNQENARHALALANVIAPQHDPAFRDAAATFRGIERRLEEVTAADAPVRVFDDYAHNPAKIAAALRTVKSAVPGKLIAIWRPHGFAPLANNLDAFAETFRHGLTDPDLGFLLPVFYAGGTASATVSSQDLATRVPALQVIEEIDDVINAVTQTASSGDAILFMGARDPDLPLMARATAKAVEEKTS